MENCTIYSHYLKFEKVIEIVKLSLPKATVEFEDNGKEKHLIATLKGGLFGKTKTLEIKYRERKNPSHELNKVVCPLTQNLSGMVNFIQSIPAENGTVRDKFLYKVMSANCEMPFMAEPEITSEFELVLRKIVMELEGFIFAQPNTVLNKSDTQYFADEELSLILDRNGHCGIENLKVSVDAKYHDAPVEEITEEQKNRKSKSEAFLETHKIKTNQHLPCVSSSFDVKIRNLHEVIDRAYALLIIGVKGEGIEQEHLDRAIKNKRIDSFSPKEKTIYPAENLNDRERAYATWRYESLYAIMWALGKMEELKYPDNICDVSAIVAKIIEPTREEFEATAQLRSTSEILDELDKTYRMHWACVDARIKGEEVAGSINSSVIYERHYLLNWLTNYQNQDWDEVTTDT